MTYRGNKNHSLYLYTSKPIFIIIIYVIIQYLGGLQIMKKKILVGLLTVATCFSLGSTSFASSASAASLPEANQSSQITPLADYSAVINMKVGERTWATGYSFVIVSTDGAAILEPYNQDAFYALRPGITVIRADFGNGNWMYYSIVVSA